MSEPRSDSVLSAEKLNLIIDALIQVMHGNFAVTLPVLSTDDPLDVISGAINIAAEELAHQQIKRRAAQEELVAAARRDTAARMQAKFVRRLVAAQEQERRRLSRELHDEASQALTGLSLNLEGILKTTEPVALKATTEKCQRICRGLVDELRRISQGLHPLILEMLGLSGAIESLMDDFRSTSRIQVIYESRFIESRKRL